MNGKPWCWQSENVASGIFLDVSDKEKKMGATENKQLMHQIFEELSKGNSEPFVASMADDFRWTVTGTTKWSRTYEGKKSVLVELFGPLRARINGRIRTTAHRLIAEGDYVVVEARGSNTTKSGVPYNNNYCFVFRLSDNQLKEVTEYLDTELVTATLGPAEA
jgi:ketosteroid isomerase-like protein